MFRFEDHNFAGAFLKRRSGLMQMERDCSDCDEQQTNYG